MAAIAERTGEIRRARPAEAELLSALAFRSKAAWGYDRAFMARCRAELTVSIDQVRARSVYVWSAAGRVLGFYALRPEGDLVEIDHLWVAPEALRRGIGRALWHHLRQEALRLGAARVGVSADPNAEGFYLRLGFSRVGTRPSGSIPGRHLPYLEVALDAM